MREKHAKYTPHCSINTVHVHILTVHTENVIEDTMNFIQIKEIRNSVQQNHTCDTFSNFSGQVKEK